MKLVYWFAPCIDDRPSYSIRERTRRAAKQAVAAQPESYGPVRKIVVQYKDAFDLLTTVLGEGWMEDT